MRTDVVFNLIGPDRVGIVEEVTEILLKLDGNVDTGRMARLGGTFAMLLLVSLPEERVPGLDAAFAHLTAQGYRVHTSPAAPAPATPSAATTYRVEVQGADHEGIVQKIAHGLSQRGINIESAETGTTRAPNTGTPLFMMVATVAVPPGLAEEQWIPDLIEAGDQENVDITVMIAGEPI